MQLQISAHFLRKLSWIITSECYWFLFSLLTTVNVLHLADRSALMLEASSAAGGRGVGSHSEVCGLG
jgi:hypothetical protein